MSLHLSKCHIVGNHMSRLIWLISFTVFANDAARETLLRILVDSFNIYHWRKVVLKLFKVKSKCVNDNMSHDM